MTRCDAAIVVPCFDEAARLDLPGLSELIDAFVRVVFVDDGSTDATAEVLSGLVARRPGRAELVRLDGNRGKAEAVRAGLLHVVERHAVVGYFDADLATPVAELERMAGLLAAYPDYAAVLASRVAMLGHVVERRAARHYLGRLYATAASLALGVAVYDTQCGAKLFRATPTLRAALADPFPDRWSFDVELLARLLKPTRGLERVRPEQLVEMPLREWHDVGGSKLHPTAAARAMIALRRVRRGARRRARR